MLIASNVNSDHHTKTTLIQIWVSTYFVETGTHLWTSHKDLRSLPDESRDHALRLPLNWLSTKRCISLWISQHSDAFANGPVFNFKKDYWTLTYFCQNYDLAHLLWEIQTEGHLIVVIESIRVVTDALIINTTNDSNAFDSKNPQLQIEIFDLKQNVCIGTAQNAQKLR